MWECLYVVKRNLLSSEKYDSIIPFWYTVTHTKQLNLATYLTIFSSPATDPQGPTARILLPKVGLVKLLLINVPLPVLF